MEEDGSEAVATPVESVPAEVVASTEPAEAATPVTAESAPAAKTDARAENKRKHMRTKVNFKGCIRSFKFGDDVVTCEDMSRGGLRFKSRKQYFEKMEIEVAAPYSPGSQAIFVRAIVVHVTELKQERRFRCGVAYSKS